MNSVSDKPKQKNEKTNSFKVNFSLLLEKTYIFCYSFQKKLLDQEYNEKVAEIFNKIKNDITNLSNDSKNFKEHALPLARIKKIMKLDDDVKVSVNNLQNVDDSG